MTGEEKNQGAQESESTSKTEGESEASTAENAYRVEASESGNKHLFKTSETADNRESVTQDDMSDTVNTKSGDEEYEIYEEYERRAESDLSEIKRMYPQFAYISHLSQIENAPRFAELRDMGLGVEEAFLATNSGNIGRGSDMYDNRTHLQSAVPRSGRDSLPHMTRSEMEAAKEIFGNLSEREIQLLWKRANG